eukprot:5514408-Alexandrium_andersonii.AAC.1
MCLAAPRGPRPQQGRHWWGLTKAMKMASFWWPGRGPRGRSARAAFALPGCRSAGRRSAGRR